MPVTVAQSAMMAVIGIGVVLVVLGALTAATILLVRLFPAQRQPEEASCQTGPPGDDEREIAAAIAVALSLARRPLPPSAVPAQAPRSPTPWAACGRESLIIRRERLQARWPKPLISVSRSLR